MFKSFKRYLLLGIAAVAFSVTASAQLPDLPVDTAVRIGQLPNGLTYYIRHNEKPAGQADFYIAQKVGSVLEEDNQRGLAHFLEHMCFNGTENFPGNGLIDWLESIGVKFGYNLNAYTSIDETVYNISAVPTARQSVQDSCLLILHDWADGLLLDPEEIDKERGVIHQEWRRSMTGQMRILENLLPVIYPNNRYGHRLPIGTMEVVDNFPPQALRDYYEAWYRPDQQGIVVVGDIDPDYIESKIVEIFSPIQMPENAPERVYFEVEDTPGTIFAIGSDPEQTNAIIEIMFKTDAYPDELKGNAQYLLIKYLTNMIGTLLNERLDEMSKSPDAPFASAGADYDNFFLSKTKDAFTVSAVAKGDNLTEPFEAVYRELLRAARGGFTEGEYQRARDEYMSRLESAYNKRESRENDSYVREYVRHFIDNEPIPSIEDEYELMKMIVPMIPVETINSIVPELITDDNRVILALAPQNDTFTVPTQEALEAVIASVEAEDIEVYEDSMKEEPLIPELPTPGSIVSIEEDAQWGAQVLTLSNGVKVVVKPTDYKRDEILMHAIALGGTSTIGDDQANNLIYLPYAMMMNGLGDYTNADLEKYTKGKQVSVDLSINPYDRELDGTSTVRDLPTMMEFIYMGFVDYALFPDEFTAMQNMLAGVLGNQEVSPQYIFGKKVAESLYESPAMAPISSEVIASADREAILDIIHSNLANAADFTFFFVGDIDMDTFKPLVEQYIATLPTNATASKTEIAHNMARETRTGATNNTYTTSMETPQTWAAIVLTGTMDYTPATVRSASIAGQILANRLLKKIREEMGAVYSIGARASLDREEAYNVTLMSNFPMKPEMKDEVLAEIHSMIQAMTGDVTEDELNPIKEFMVKSAIESQEKNESWLNGMVGNAINGVDTFNNAVEGINAITVQDIQNFVQNLLDQGNYHIVILDPAE